jgi:hypothetical protein
MSLWTRYEAEFEARREEALSRRILLAMSLGIGLVTSFRLDEKEAALQLMRDARKRRNQTRTCVALATITAACLDAWSRTEPEEAAASWTLLAAEAAGGSLGCNPDVA